MGYKDFKLKWSKCEGCDLFTQRTRQVFARGTIPCDVLFIGEAPGQSEDVLGKPFVGPAGKLLDFIVNKGIDGQLDCAFTNLVCCFPRLAKNTGNHEPPKEAIKACQERLREFCKLCRPRAIVCVGTLAEKWVPPALQKVYKGKQYYSLLHPAFLLRLDEAQRPLAIRRSIVILEDLVQDLS